MPSDCLAEEEISCGEDDSRGSSERCSVSSSRPVSRKMDRWTKEEDDLLVKLVHSLGEDWKAIANHFLFRKETHCQQRWAKVLNPELVKGSWTKEEDGKLISLVSQYGNKKWSCIAQHLVGRTGKQCRERYHNHLDPNVNKSPWTKEEDRILLEAHELLGNKWAEISRLLPGRSDNAVKNHWNTTFAKRLKLDSPSSVILPHSVKSGRKRKASKEAEVYITPDSTIISHEESNSFDESRSASSYVLPHEHSQAELVDKAKQPMFTPLKRIKVLAPGDGSSPPYLKVGKIFVPEAYAKMKFILSPLSAFRMAKGKAVTADEKESCTESTNAGGVKTPVKEMTPVKELPFSPSQFLNGSYVAVDSSASVSTPSASSVPRPNASFTPVVLDGALRTPLRHTQLILRTPTPFKEALAALHKNGAPINVSAHTPAGLADDLREIIDKERAETEPSSTDTQTHTPDDTKSEECGGYSTGKENVPARLGCKRVRKALHVTWSSVASLSCKSAAPESISELTETPSKTLVEESTLLFSPAPAIAEVTSESQDSLGFHSPSRKEKSMIDIRWETIVCGRTRDQIEMTERARNYLNNHRRRALVL